MILKGALNPWAQIARSPPAETRVKEVRRIAISPDGRSLAWGDGGGNVFFSSIAGGPVAVVSDRTFSKPPLDPHDECLYAMDAIEFQDKGVFYWLDHWGTAWRADAADKGFIAKKVNPGTPFGWGGTIVGDSFVLSKLRATNPIAFLLSPYDYVLRRYSLADGRLLGTCELYPRKARRYHYPNAMAVSPDRKWLAIASENNAGIVNMETFKLEHTLGIEFGKALAFSADSTILAISIDILSPLSCSEVRIYDAAKGSLLSKHLVDTGGGDIITMAFGPDNRLWFYGVSGLHTLSLKTGLVSGAFALNECTALLVNDKGLVCAGLWNGSVNIYASEKLVD
jgi:hypothetical protein